MMLNNFRILLVWGVERSLSKLKPKNEMGHRKELGREKKIVGSPQASRKK